MTTVRTIDAIIQNRKVCFDDYIDRINNLPLEDHEIVILRNLFLYISCGDSGMSEVKKQLIFLTCFNIVLKFEKEMSYDLDSFRVFSQDLLLFYNIREKIIEFELVILQHINFDLTAFSTLKSS